MLEDPIDGKSTLVQPMVWCLKQVDQDPPRQMPSIGDNHLGYDAW